jgi:hypothetical protein
MNPICSYGNVGMSALLIILTSKAFAVIFGTKFSIVYMQFT